MFQNKVSYQISKSERASYIDHYWHDQKYSLGSIYFEKSEVKMKV